MRTVTCPLCGSVYEQHPMTQAAQEICPSCRNATPWTEISKVLAEASQKVQAKVGGRATARVSALQHVAEHLAQH